MHSCCCIFAFVLMCSLVGIIRSLNLNLKVKGFLYKERFSFTEITLGLIPTRPPNQQVLSFSHSRRVEAEPLAQLGLAAVVTRPEWSP
jgi:hypothetical protein